MTVEQIRAWKARMDLASARNDGEEAETPHDPVRNRMIAEALEWLASANGDWLRNAQRRHCVAQDCHRVGKVAVPEVRALEK